MVSLGSFFNRGQPAPAGRAGQRAYAVGDVHGRLDLLQSMLEIIEYDAQSRRNEDTTIVFLGDLIDRGPDSAGVVELLRNYKPAFAETTFLMGNHEEVMLRVLEGDSELLERWLTFGGSECLHSYGVNPQALKMEPGMARIATLRRAIPASHVEFVSSFADTATFGTYVFAHAGLRPGVPLADQNRADLRWIRDPFLNHEGDYGFTVVHGHTITAQPEIRHNRIAIDTGAYRTGILTAVVIEGQTRRFLQTRESNPTRLREF